MSKTTPITPGAVSILSVGEGHIRLSFDKDDEVERIRAARIVKDMLRRGYALLLATPGPDGQTVWTRAKDFDEETCEYIIADFDPQVAAVAPPERNEEPPGDPPPGDPPPYIEGKPPGPKSGRRAKPALRRVSAATTELVAVGRTAGG